MIEQHVGDFMEEDMRLMNGMQVIAQEDKIG